jgi:hypothetical protein
MNTTDQQHENIIANTPYQIDLKYMLEVDTNGNEYHVELTLNQDNLSKSKIEKTHYTLVKKKFSKFLIKTLTSWDNIKLLHIKSLF